MTPDTKRLYFAAFLHQDAICPTTQVANETCLFGGSTELNVSQFIMLTKLSGVITWN